jgi:hypothetical protein
MPHQLPRDMGNDHKDHKCRPCHHRHSLPLDIKEHRNTRADQRRTHHTSPERSAGHPRRPQRYDYRNKIPKDKVLYADADQPHGVKDTSHRNKPLRHAQKSSPSPTAPTTSITNPADLTRIEPRERQERAKKRRTPVRASLLHIYQQASPSLNYLFLILYAINGR